MPGTGDNNMVEGDDAAASGGGGGWGGWGNNTDAPVLGVLSNPATANGNGNANTAVCILLCALSIVTL